MHVRSLHFNETKTGVNIELTKEEARDLYLDLAQSTPYRVTTVTLRDRLKETLGIKMCPVRNPDCKNEATDYTYRVTCFNNHFRTRQYCSHHVVQVQNGLIDCAKCTEIGQRHKVVMLGLEK